MNDWDRNNLNFILNSKDKTFNEWMMSASNDDIEYALELIAAHKRELMNMESRLCDEVTDFTEARALINRIKEKL